MFVFGLVIGAGVSGAIVWLAKDRLVILFKGASAAAADLRAQAAKLEATLSNVKAAL